MSIEAQLTDEMKAAMRQKDQDKLACIRQVRSKVQEATNAADFKGPSDDAFYQRIIAGYVKMLQKSLGDFVAAGEKGAALLGKYKAEIAYLEKYLPKTLSEAETRELVKKTVATLGVTDPKQAGKVMGALMKEHRGVLDAGLVKRLVDDVLTGK